MAVVRPFREVVVSALVGGAIVASAACGAPSSTGAMTTTPSCPSRAGAATAPTASSAPAAKSISGDGASYLSQPLLPRSAWVEISALSDDTPPDDAPRPPYVQDHRLVTGEMRIVRAHDASISSATYAPGFLLRSEDEVVVREALAGGATVLVNITTVGNDSMFVGRFPTALFPDGTVLAGSGCLEPIPDLATKAATTQRTEAAVARDLIVSGPQAFTPPTTQAWIDRDPGHRQVVPGEAPGEVFERVELRRITVEYPEEWATSDHADGSRLCARSSIGWGECVGVTPGSGRPAVLNAYREPGTSIDLFWLDGSGWDSPQTLITTFPPAALDTPWVGVSLSGSRATPTVTPLG